MTTTKKQREIGDDGDSEGSSKSLPPSLPFHIVAYDILTRIPIDCLMTFRSVCKSWSSLILYDSDFIKLHSSRTYASLGFLHLSGNYPDSHFYVKGSDDENNENFDVENSDDKNSDDENSDDENSDEEEDREPELEETEPFQDWMRGVKKSKGISFYDIGKEKFKLFYFRKGLFNKKLKIRGSFYGLVILSCEEGNNEFSHHVYNPITRDSIKLPVLNDPVILQRLIDDLDFYLVFDPATEKYKVVCIAWNYVIVPMQNYVIGRIKVSSMTTQYFFKILTLGTGAGSDSWRHIDIPDVGFCVRGDRYKPVSVNGSLNLLCRYGSEVLCIDVSKESYHTIEYPEGASETSKLLEIQGSLCILDYTNNSNLLDMDQYRNHLDTESMGKFTLWFLTEVENTKKWLKKYDIDMFHNPCGAGPFKSAPVFVEGILNPTLKIIFCVSTSEYENHRDAEDRYYSYDVELKRLESIYRPDPSNYRQWHFNRLIHI